jgi:hypothetical protein
MLLTPLEKAYPQPFDECLSLSFRAPKIELVASFDHPEKSDKKILIALHITAPEQKMIKLRSKIPIDVSGNDLPEIEKRLAENLEIKFELDKTGKTMNVAFFFSIRPLYHSKVVRSIYGMRGIFEKVPRRPMKP